MTVSRVGPARAQRETTAMLRSRLLAHGLVGERLRTPAEVVGRLLAVQAQDFASGLWAVGVRAQGSTVASVSAALDSGEVVRTWPMRGTLHLVPAEDAGWMVGVAASRVLSGMAGRHRQLELDQADFDTARGVAERLLGGGGRATRDEFMAALQNAGIHTTGQRGPHLIATLAMTSLVCWGPTATTTTTQQQSLVLTEEWITSPRSLDPDEALGEFVFRYLDGHGPATVKDFVWWSKLTVAQAKRGWAVVQDRLVEQIVGGVSTWTTTRAAAADEAAKASGAVGIPRVLALPGFDEYLLGYTNRDPVLPPEHASQIVPGGNGVFLPLITVDGRIVGTWRRRVAKDRVTITPVPFAPLSGRARTGFATAAKGYARFLGLDAVLAEAEVLEETVLGDA
ncbi:winged helix DNA-binding domain-containing protein [Plantibacter sp. YIM 135249]|uniref:winged helix DNA-binding domain-containing protein n=1 Tax=Plantibacter sp. YIM 135249 TaxID=3423918 RepID=UPI003D32BE38